MTEVSLTLDDTLGDIVASRPAAARVLDRFQLDYCCAGSRTLAAACEAQALDAVEVLAQLAETPAAPESWTALTPAALADHIVDTHHAYLYGELPLLDALAEKVDTVHGQRHPELRDVHRLVTELRADLEPHLFEEEEVVFPAIRAALADGSAAASDAAVDALATLATLESDHDRAGELLVELRRAAGDFAVPADACNSYRSLYERLEALETDLHAHVHKENHTLFPAARRAVAVAVTGTGGNN